MCKYALLQNVSEAMLWIPVRDRVMAGLWLADMCLARVSTMKMTVNSERTITSNTITKQQGRGYYY